MRQRAVLLSLAGAAAAAAFLQCIGDPPLAPLGESADASADALGRDGAVTPDASAADGAGDDANACGLVTKCLAGDGCCPAGCTSKTDSDCAVAVCGDGVVQPGEACDDGNKTNGDACDPTCSFANTLERVAGFPGGPGYADSDAGANVRFNKQGGLATDGARLYYADPGGTIRSLDPKAGASTTIAGANADTQTAVDDAGTNARFTAPSALAYLDASSVNGERMLFVLDGSAIRAINLRDPSYPVASVHINAGQSIAAGVTSAGTQLFNLASSEIQSYVVTPGGFQGGAPIASQTQVNTVVYGGPQATWGPANCQEVAYGGYDTASKTATFYVGCPATLLKVVASASGSTVTLLAGAPKTPGCADNANPLRATVTSPVGLSVDAAGTLYFNDCNKIRKVDANGVGTYAGDGKPGWIDGNAGRAAEFTALGSSAVLGSTLYVVDGPRIRTVTAGGTTSTLASGSGSRGVTLDPTGASASLAGVLALATDPNGMPYALLARQVVKIDPATGGISLAFTPVPPPDAGGPMPTAVAMASMNGKLYVALSDNTVWESGFDGSGLRKLTTAAVTAMTSDGTSLFYVSQDLTIGQIAATGAASVVVGKPFANVVQDGSGNMAGFERPLAIASVGNGTLYVSDGYDGFGNTVLRRIDVAAGKVTTVAGRANNDINAQADGVGKNANFTGINFLASDGVSLFAVDSGFGYAIPLLNGATMRQMDLGTLAVTTMLGTQGQYAAAPGVGKGAHLNRPSALVFDPASKRLFLADESAIFHVR